MLQIRQREIRIIRRSHEVLKKSSLSKRAERNGGTFACFASFGETDLRGEAV
jgi:hypothetical protein